LKKINFLFLTLLAITACYGQQKDYVITDYGAKPDGVTNNVNAIQHAIDDAFNNGGGRVVFLKGKFLSGVIHLKSNVELFIEEGASLLASTNRSDYGPSQKASAFIVADSAINISIKGSGTIDGQCDLLIKDIYEKLRSGALFDKEWKEFNPWNQRRPAENNRPRIIEFKYCKGVTVKNIHLKNGTSWIQNYYDCVDVVIDSEHVLSNAFWNNDGIDITDCKNVSVTNCNINAADDGICLKSESRDSRCENVYVANCKVRSSASAVKLGTASRGGFKNIVIKNIEVYDTYRSAIAIEAVDGGIVENVDVRNIHAVNTGNAIFVRLGHRNKDTAYSRLRNVYIGDVKVQVAAGKPDKGYTMEGPELKYPVNFKRDASTHYQSVSPWNNSGIDSSAVPYPHNVFPSSITGLPGHPVENVILENIEITYDGGGSKEVNYFPLDSFRVITEAEKDYPEFSMFGEVPVWGLYVRHANNINLKNIKLINKKSDYRTAVLVDDAKQIALKNFAVAGASSFPVLFFNNSDPLVLDKIDIPGNKKETIKINSDK
jgi:hypothetical protein